MAKTKLPHAHQETSSRQLRLPPHTNSRKRQFYQNLRTDQTYQNVPGDLNVVLMETQLPPTDHSHACYILQLENEIYW